MTSRDPLQILSCRPHLSQQLFSKNTSRQLEVVRSWQNSSHRQEQISFLDRVRMFVWFGKFFFEVGQVSRITHDEIKF